MQARPGLFAPFAIAVFLVATISSPLRAGVPVVSTIGPTSSSSSSSGGSSGKSSSNVFIFGGSLLFFNNESTQDGQKLPGGTNVYSQFNLQYDLIDKFCGFGLVYQYDSLGKTQVNTAVGGKLEAVFKGYYAELGWAQAEQKFVDRAVQKRSGTQIFYAFGMRFAVLHQLFYFDGGVRRRVTTLTKQDGVTMAAPLEETLLMPYIGAGVSI